MSFFKKLFHTDRKKTAPLSDSHTISTAPLSDQQIQETLGHSLHFEPPQLISGCGSSVGKQRDHNEDSLMALSLNIGGEGKNTPFGLYIIADGMGGHQFGEVASGTAMRTLSGYILKKFQPYLADSSQVPDESMQEIMHSAVDEAQRAVMQAAPGSGTTLTAILVFGEQLTVGHVGDSRAYIIRANGITEALTRDHSLVRRLEELGQISPEEAAAHPQRNVLYRAIGQGEFLEPDVFTTPFPQPSYLLLCSDGLWSVVPPDDFTHIIKDAPNLQSACNKLVAAANAAGGPDNISVIIVQLFN